LLKSTRNNFFTYRFVSGDNIIESKYLKQFYNSDVERTHRLAPKLTEKHINSGPFQKMKVKYASQVFSKTVFCAMSTSMTDGSLSIEAKQTIQFIDSMDNLFDIFNSQVKIKPLEADIDSDDEPLGEKRFCLPYKNLDYQKQFLLSMFNFFKNLKIQQFNILKNQWVDINKSNNIKFLTGWMISIAGLIRLHDTLVRENNIFIEIMTRRLNQDCLKNFFGTIRSQNGNCINSTTIQFQRTFKKLFCLNYFEYNEGANCLEDVEEVLTSLSKTSREDLQIIFPEKTNVIKIKPLPIDGTDYRSLEFNEKRLYIHMWLSNK
jgi:DNA transposase THAP9